MTQEQVHAGGASGGTESEEAAGLIQHTSAGLDDLLEHIDTVLEEDAVAFVEGFVQKGGQ